PSGARDDALPMVAAQQGNRFMNWGNVRLIFLREVRDQLRDRRTLFMIAVLPVLLYPALGIGTVGMTVTFTRQARTVVVLGAADLPGAPLLEGDRFASRWFDAPAQVDLLSVVSDGMPSDAVANGEAPVSKLLATAKRVRDAHRDHERLDREHAAAVDAGDEAAAERLAVQREAAERHRAVLFSDGGLQVLILVPPEMKAKLAAANALIRTRDASATEIEIPKPLVLYNGADEKSLVAYAGVREVLGEWENELLKDRLRIAEVPVDLPDQIAPTTIDLARDEERSRALWSKLFPALLVIMTVTGAFYPAVDLAAGEKERGTMETLLICPASRAEIVFGKFLTVMLFSSFTALLNLLTMGLTGRFMASFDFGGATSAAEIFSPPLASLIWVIVLLMPLSALFSALCLSLATFARSSKEGQYHLTPLLLVTVGLTVFCLSPAIEITPLYSVLPVIGVSLLLKELLAGGDGYVYLAPVLVTSFGYAAIALWWAIEQFSREEVLFREAEQFEPRLWLRQLLRDKEDTPSFAEAGFCFVLVMLLQFGAMKVFADAVAGGPADEYDVRILKVLLVQQIAIVATPALLMGVILTRSVWKTFRLRLPAFRYFAVGAVLPLALMPLAVSLLERMSWFFPPLPPSVIETLQLLKSTDVPLWLTLLAFAAAPALCEEITFRGFILSGFLKGRRMWLAIALSSFAFGLMHMIPQQVFNATLLGLVLGLLAVRSGSLWPGVLFHFIFNSSNVVLGRVAPQYADGGYPWPVLLLCAVVAGTLIGWLIRTGRKSTADSSRPPRVEETHRRDDVTVGAM
ncbi:MAG: ABC transporter permease subunit/CPBP intramembrane protease, partial [Planctomycetaceae bacterium]